jgi:hypothetical protein
MIVSTKAATMRSLIARILARSRAAERFGDRDWFEAVRDLESTAERDYGANLRKSFSRNDLRGAVGVFRRHLPALNREMFRIRDPQDLAAMASQLGARFQARAFPGPRGRELRGFYANGEGALMHPVICVNSRHHPVAVVTTFWHEVGHHLTNRLIARPAEELTMSFGKQYACRLDDPGEVLADVMVALVAYPRPVADRLFDASMQRRSSADGPDIVLPARKYLRLNAGFDFDARSSAIDNLNYLAGMIHYAKLRRALLAEYQI